MYLLYILEFESALSTRIKAWVNRRLQNVERSTRQLARVFRRANVMKNKWFLKNTWGYYFRSKDTEEIEQPNTVYGAGLNLKWGKNL